MPEGVGDAGRHLSNAAEAMRIGSKPTVTESEQAWLRDRMEEMAGVRDLEEANRRMDVVTEWRRER